MDLFCHPYYAYMPEKLFGIYLTNNWGNRNDDSSSLYSFLSRYNHSCNPTCDILIGSGLGVRVRMRHHVAINTELTLCYTNEAEDVFRRRKHILQNWHFKCFCTRCIRELKNM